jgi:hypothetical protein
MKKIGILFALSIFLSTLHAQTLEEWTRQKKTRIKRLLEQIAANQVYIEYARKGYQIVTAGLHTIGDIKNGDFRLHLGFIDSLKAVNPSIRSWPKVADIITLQFQVIQSGKQALDAVRASGQFTRDEVLYCKTVFENLLAECGKNVDALNLVIIPGRLSMDDEQRIRRIHGIWLNLRDQSAFASSFSHDVSLLAIQRLTEQTDINYSKQIDP